MTQMQEGEQQEEAKKPKKNVFWRGFYWFTCIGASLLSFIIIWLWVDWGYDGNWWQACLIVLVGIGFYILLCAWNPLITRIVGIVGSVLWSIIVWPVGYASADANMHNNFSRVGPVIYQLGLICGASMPFVLLFFAFIMFKNQRDFIGE